jgi:hypothetical protein
MFIQSSGEFHLVETGDKLGDMTSELKILVIISEFVSGRTKNYAYTIIDSRNSINQTKTVCKIRDIILNCNASQLKNFYVIKELILKEEPSHTMTVQSEHKIKRKRKLRDIVSIITEHKDNKYRVSFFKRRRLLEYISVPFG